MALNVPREWQVPPAGCKESKMLGWLNEATQEGQLWYESQRGYKDVRKALDIISGDPKEVELLDYRSRISGHRLKTNIRVAIAGLSNIRPMWGYHANTTYAAYANVLNRTSRALYLEGCWDQSIRETLCWAAACGTGYARPVYMRDMAGTGRGNLKILSYGQPCVLPVQIPSNGDIQEAYAVNLMDEMPIFAAHAKWPDFQDQLKPTNSKYWYASDIRGASKRNSRRNLSLFRNPGRDPQADVYVPIRWTTVLDLSVNNSAQPIAMGQPGSTWAYTVPYIGQELPGGRVAGPNEARIYPQRRLIISTETCVLYDGPAFNWHGKVDLIPFSLDRWPWEPTGFSLVHDGWEIQKAIDAIDRGIMDKINALNNLPLAYDINAVPKSDAESFDPFAPRDRIGYDGGQSEKPFQMPVPPEVYRVEPEILQYRKDLNELLDYLTQTRDITELSKARALGKGMDQLEALISASGPLVRDMSRMMEASLIQVGEQVGWMIPQWMTTARLMQYCDPDTMAQEVFDFDPGSLVPSHIPGDQPFDEMDQPKESQYTLMERAKWFAGNVKFMMMPHSAHEILQMTYRLMLLQLRQRGMPIAAATVMESCNVQDVAKPDGNTEQERFYAEKEDELFHMARLAKIMQGMGLDPAALGGGAGKGKGGGRPNTYEKPPHMVQKGDGRPVVSTSE